MAVAHSYCYELLVFLKRFHLAAGVLHVPGVVQVGSNIGGYVIIDPLEMLSLPLGSLICATGR